MISNALNNKVFLLLLVAVTLAFGAILWPYAEAIFWGITLAILFSPLQRWLFQRMPKHRTLAALITLLLCLVIVILPTALLSVSLLQEATHIYDRLRSGQIDFGDYFQQIVNSLPTWASSALDRLGLTSVLDLEKKLSSVAVQGSQFIATRALNIGQNTFQFLVSLSVMLYLLFFMLRDGPALSARVRKAIPIDESYKRNLSEKFTTVIRATIKGNIVVAATQGLLGGFIFWMLDLQGALLWGVMMAFLSLLPAVGAGLIWVPVAIYFFATGAVMDGAILTAFGVVVIGLVDNLLRPLLVGKDTKLPDYLVLISTLGGMALFGLSGFVIGPAVAALFIAIWDLFTRRNEHDGSQGST